MKKRIVTGLLLFVSALVFIDSNFSQNGIYYATNQQKQGHRDRTLYEIACLWSERTVPEVYLEYDIDRGLVGVINNHFRLSTMAGDVILESNDVSFTFNQEGEVKEIYLTQPENFKEVALKEKNTRVAYIIRDDFVKPIAHYQKEPRINLQWLYNLIYND